MTRIVNRVRNIRIRPAAPCGQSPKLSHDSFGLLFFVARFQGVVGRGRSKNVGSRTDGKYRPYTRSSQWRWLVSLVLHGGLVALAMHAAMEVKPHLQPETFFGMWHCTRRRHRVLLLLRRFLHKSRFQDGQSPRNQCLRPSRVLRERRFPRSWSGRQSFKRFRLRKSPASSRTLRPSGAPVGRDRGTTGHPRDRLRSNSGPSSGDPATDKPGRCSGRRSAIGDSTVV